MATPKKFMNIDEAVMEWAWQQFEKNMTRKQKRIREKERRNKNKYIGWQIDWRDVRVTDETTWPSLIDDSDDTDSSNSAVTTSRNQQIDVRPPAAAVVAQSHISSSAGPRASVLFQTRFTNNTTETQEYTLKTEKTTRSSMSTCVETGFTHGFEMSVKLASPCQVFEANAGYKREFSLSNVSGETFEEELTWGVESVIQVKAQHIAEATLVVDEKRQTGNFVVDTRLRGMVMVTFTALRDNNSQIKAVGNDIADIVRDYAARERRKGSGGVSMDGVEVLDDGTVKIRTCGTCKFRYGIKQDIVVNQTKIE